MAVEWGSSALRAAADIVLAGAGPPAVAYDVVDDIRRQAAEFFGTVAENSAVAEPPSHHPRARLAEGQPDARP